MLAPSSQEEEAGESQNVQGMLKEGSQDLLDYITVLKQETVCTNPKLICCYCWCKLSQYQRQRHCESHENGIKTASKFNSLESFCSLVNEFRHIKILGNKIFYQKLNEKPTTLVQLKKTKLNDSSTTTQKEPPVLIDLSDFPKQILKDESDFKINNDINLLMTSIGTKPGSQVFIPKFFV